MHELPVQLSLEILRKIDLCPLNTPVYYEINVDNKYIFLGKRLSLTDKVQIYNLSKCITNINENDNINITQSYYISEKNKLVDDTFTALP